MTAVVLSGVAPAVSPPVPKGQDYFLQIVIVGQYGPTFAHGHVVGRVEAERGQIAEGARVFSVVPRAQGITVVLDEPETVIVCYLGDGAEVGWVAQGVGNENRFSFICNRIFEEIRLDVVRAQFHVYEHRNEIVLEDGVERRGEATRGGNDFVPGIEPSPSQLRGSQS